MQGAEVVVAHRAGEGAPLDGLPEVPLLFRLLPAPADEAALGAEERLVGRARHEVGALVERLLEMRPDEAEDVRHVVHEHGVDADGVEEGADFVDRLGVQHHALAEDDELWALPLDEIEERRHVGLVRIVGQHRDVDDRGHLGARVAGHVVAQGAHRLGAQVAALGDVVVDDLADAARLRLAVGAVEVVDEGAEHGRVGHLPADHAGLDLRAAQVGAQLVGEQTLDLVDEAGALIVEDLEVVEGLGLLVLGVAERGVHDREQARHGRGRHLRGDEVDALVLPPDVVADGAGEQPQGLLAGLAALQFAELRRVVPHDGAGARRGVAAHVVGHHEPGDAACRARPPRPRRPRGPGCPGTPGRWSAADGPRSAWSTAPRPRCPSRGRRCRWSPSRAGRRRRGETPGHPRGRCRGRSRPTAA